MAHIRKLVISNARLMPKRFSSSMRPRSSAGAWMDPLLAKTTFGECNHRCEVGLELPQERAAAANSEDQTAREPGERRSRWRG